MPEYTNEVGQNIIGNPAFKEIPQNLNSITPTNYTTPVHSYDLGRFGNNGSNPLGDFLTKIHTQGPSLEQLGRPIGFDASGLDVERYRQSPDFQKLGLELDGSNEERYGLNQSWGEVLSNGFTGMRKLAANGFVDNWRGFGRIFDSLVTWDWSKLKGDATSMLELDKTMKDIMNENPIYATKEGENTFWNRQTWGNFLQQSGFTVGAAAGMLSEHLITKAIEAGLTATGVGAPLAGAIETATDIQTAENITRWGRLMGKGKDFFDAAKNFKALKKLGDVWKEESVIKNFMMSVGRRVPGIDIGVDLAKTYRAAKISGIGGAELAWDLTKVGVGGVKRTLSEANFAFTEARMESAGTYSDLYSKLYQDYVDLNGKRPDAVAIENINKAAMQAADKNFNFNTAVLAISNRIQFDNIFKNNKVMNQILSKYGLDEAVENRIKVVGKLKGTNYVRPHYYETGMFGGVGAFKKVAADFGKGKAFQVAGGSLLKGMARMEVTEGIQELLQEGSNVYFQDYYRNVYNASINPDFQPEGDSFKKAVGSQLNMQGVKTFMSGALTGLIIHGPTALSGKALKYGNEKIIDMKKTSGMTAEEKAKYFKDKETQKAAPGAYYAKFNAFAKDPSAAFQESIKNLNFQKEGSTALEDAAKNQDKFTYENIRTAMLDKMIVASIRNNTYEGLKDTLVSYSQHMTKEEFEKAFVGADYSSENKKTVEDYTNRIIESIDSYTKTWNKLQERYGNKFNPNRFKPGTKEFFKETMNKKVLNDMIEILASNEFKATDSLDRITSIFRKVSSNKNLGASLADAFHIMGSELNITSEVGVLTAEIKLAKEQLKVEGITKEDRQKLEENLSVKEEQLKHINDWKASKGELLNEAVVDKSYKAFAGYLASKNKQNGRELNVDKQDVEDHFTDFIDYIKLHEKHNSHVDAINMLSNTENFMKLHERMNLGASRAYMELLGMAGAEHVKKMQGDGKTFILSIHDVHALYEPDGTLIEVFDTIEEANKAKAEADKNITGEESKPAETQKENVNATRVTIKVKDKNGVDADVELIEGNKYITESNPTKRVGKDKQIYTTYEQDIIKIDKINTENNTVTVTLNNSGEAVTYDLEEFADLVGKITNFTKLTPDQQIYFQYRDSILRINVSKTNGTLHKITGVHANRDYTNNSYTVNARLELKQENNKWVLKLKYTNPVTQKEVFVDFNMAYYKKYAKKDASGKAALSLNILPTVAEAQELARKQRVALVYQQQMEALKFLIQEQENKVGLRQKRTEEIDQQIANLKDSIEEMYVSLQIAEENIAELRPQRSKLANATRTLYNQIIAQFPGKIIEAKELAAKLELEKADVQKELEALKETKKLYVEGLTELEQEKEPFLRDESGTIYGEQQEAVNKAETNQLRTRVPEERLDDVILGVEIEQEALTEKLNIVYDAIKKMEKVLSRFVKYNDLIETIFRTDNMSDKSLGRLSKNLVALRNKENGKANPDAEKIDLINTLLGGINKNLKSLIEPGEAIINQVMSKEVMQALTVLTEYKFLKEDMSEILERMAELQDKLDRLTLAKDQIAELKNLNSRLQFLKDLQAAITEGFQKSNAINLITQTSKSVTAITKQAAQEFSEFGDIMSDEEVVTDDENDKIFIGDVDKPLLNNGGLFKTADRHYFNDTDKEPTNPQAARFFRFSETIALDGTYYFMAVSKANDEFGITIESYDEFGKTIAVTDDIKLVVVKKVGDKFQYVGVDGKVLDNPTKETLVYTSMPNNVTIMNGSDEEVLNYLKDAKSPFTTKGMSDEEILNEVKKFKGFRNDVLNKTKNKEVVHLKVTEKSKGIQKREPLDVATNRPQELALQGRLVENNPNFSNLLHPDGSEVTIEVVTGQNSASKRIQPGRLVLIKTKKAENGSKDTTEFQVYNRQMQEQEKENLFNVLLAMLPMYGRRNPLSDERKEQLNELFSDGKITSEQLVRLTTQLTNEEANQFDLAISYIAGLVHFNQLDAGETPSKNQFYISGGSFFIRGKEYMFEVDGQLNLDAITNAKDEILETLYHNVNNSMLSGKRKNNKFSTAKVVDGKIVEDKTFANYLAYLLTDKVKGHTPVIYTNIVPYSPIENINEPQLKNVYLKFQGPNEQAAGQKPAPAATSTQTPAAPTKAPAIVEELNDQGYTTGFFTFSWNGITYRSETEQKAKEALANLMAKATAAPVAATVVAPTATTSTQTSATNEVFDNPVNVPLLKGKTIVFSRVPGDKQGMLNVFAEWNGSKFVVTKVERTNGVKYDDELYNKIVLQDEEFLNDFYTGPLNGYFERYNEITKPDIKQLVDEEIAALKKRYTLISTERAAAPQAAAPVVQQAAPVAPVTNTGNLFEEVLEAHYGSFIYQSSKFWEKNLLTTPQIYDNNFDKVFKQIAKDRGLDTIGTSALLSTIITTIFENRIVNDKTGIQGLIDNINKKFNLNIKLDISAYEKLSLELNKLDNNMSLKVLGNKTLSDVEKIKISEELTLARNKWTQETINIVNSIMSQIDPSIPKLEVIKATKENTTGIANYDRKNVLDNFAVNLKAKNKGTHERVMAVLNKYGISFDDFIKDIESYYKGTKTIVTQTAAQDVPTTPVVQSTDPASITAAAQAALQLLNSRNKTTSSDNGHHRLYLKELVKEKENIEEFKKTLARILPQIGLEIANDLIDGRAMGKFIKGMIQIYQNAGAGTGFHEAFEAVWNSYLTTKEQNKLIEEFRNRPGKFTNIFTGETKDHSKATAYDVKEMLAEEFIPYMRSDKGIVKENSPVRNTLFRKILNFFKNIWKYIQEAFGITTAQPENSAINEMFRKIAAGEFANAKELENVESQMMPAFRSTLTGTDIEFTQKLMEGMAAQFFIDLYAGQNNIKALFDGSKPLLFNQLYAGVANNVMDRFDENKDFISNHLSQLGFNQEAINNQLVSMPDMLNQLLAVNSMNTEVRDLFKKYISQFGLEFKDVKSSIDDEVKETMAPEEIERNDRLGIVEAMFIDPRDMTKAEVKLLIASLPSDEYTADGITTNRRNELGLPVLEDFARKLNLLHNELHSTVAVTKYNAKTKRLEEVPALDQMFGKLDARFKKDGRYKVGYEWIARLKTRLAYEDANGSKRDITTLNRDEVALLVAFESSFSNNRNNPHKLIVGPDGVIYSDNTLDSTNAKRIREDWQNNIKYNAKQFLGTSEEELKKAPMVYINANAEIVFNTLSDEFVKIINVTTPLQMVDSLRKLGFDFTATDEEVVLEAGASQISKDFSAIKSKFDDGSIRTFDDLFGRQIVNGRINNLIAIEQKFTGDETILSTRNAEGKQQYSITQPSALSYLTNSFKAIDNLTDFVASNPQFGQVDLQTGEVVLNPYIAGALLLKKDGLLFDSTGKKRKGAKFEYRYILGISGQAEAAGTSTDRLEFPDKVVQEIYHILDGTYFTIINSDKSSEFGLHVGHFINFSDLKLGSVAETPEIIDLYKEGLKDELRTALFESGNNKYKIKDYSDNVVKLGNFREIIKLESNETVKKLFADYMAGKITEDQFVGNDIISTLITNYANSKVEENIKWLEDIGLVTVDRKTNIVKTNMFSNEQLQGLAEKFPYKNGAMPLRDFKKLITFITTNRQLAVFEQHKLLFGHPALYKELAKRSSGINSQKQAITENSQYLRWMDGNMSRFDGKQRTNRFRFLSHTDPEAVSMYLNNIAEGMYDDIKTFFETDDKKISKTDKKIIEKIIGVEFNDDGTVKDIVGGKGTHIDPYINASEADGGAYIMPDFFRDMHFLSGKLLAEQDDLLRYENAREVIDRSNPNHPMYNIPGFAKTYTQGEIDDAVDLLVLFDEKPKAILQVLKPQGFGYQTTKGLMHTSMLKHSVVPLTWSRVIDKPNMLGKYLQAQADQVDIIGFTSGQKVGVVTKLKTKEEGTRTIQPLYDENGAFNQEAPPVQEMYTKYYGFQVEMAAYSKDSTIFGSQMRKINLSNIPKDNLELRAFAEEYNRLIDSLTATEFRAVLKDLGLRQVGEDYVTDDLDSMMKTLKSEMERRDLPDNVLDMLTVMIDANTGVKRVQYRFDASPVREKLDNILNAIIDSRILAQTMHGKAAVQVPATMFETSDRMFTYKGKDGKYVEPVKGSELTPAQRKVAKMVSANLNFYTKDKPYMEVMVPNFFKDVFKEGEEIKLSDLDPRLLQAIGFRIPSQAMNSIDSIRIAGFLDPQWGDMIVVPSELVAKAGSDFDIDKLNLFLANYYIDKKSGKPTYIEYSTSDAELQDRYIRYINEYVDSDTKLYVQKLENYSGEKTSLEDKYKNNKDVIFSDFKKARESYDKQYEDAKQNIFKISNDSKTNDDSIKGYKREGYALFKTLPLSIKQPFYDLKDDGVVAVSENKALAERLLQANPNASYAPTLMQMIQYHEAMLDVYAQVNSWTDEQLDALADRANAALGKWENWKEENLEKTREEFLKSLKQYRVEYAQELARVSGEPTLEEFKELPIEQQNSKKARQNRLIEVMRDILGHPANYRQMVVPNGATTLKNIATKIRQLKNLPPADPDMTSLSEWKNMTEVRERYITGKKLVGVIALQITSHSLSQYGDVELNGVYYENGNPVKINIKFDSNTAEGKYMLNLIEDKGHKWISELLSEAMTAAVDAAKDPFIFDLNLTLNTANVWFYLQKLGVTVEDIAYLHTQPIIETYFKELSKNNSLINKINGNELSKKVIKYVAMEQFLMKAFPDLNKFVSKVFNGTETFKSALTSKYEWKTNKIIEAVDNALKTLDNVDMYTTSELESMIKPMDQNGMYNLNKEEAIKQLQLFQDYQKYEDQGRLLGNFIKAISYDTSRTKNINENRLQEAAYRQAEKDNFVTADSLERVMDGTFLGKIKDIKDDVPAMFKNFFITAHPKTKAVMDKMFDVVLEDQYMSKDDKMDLLNRYQNFVINYLLHTVKFKAANGKQVSVYSYYKDLFIGENSMGKQLKEFQKKYPDNKGLKNLFAVINTDTKDTDNITLFNTRLTTFEINAMGESLEQLKQTADKEQDKPLQSFVNDLSIFLMAQSGVQQSPISFSKIMPISLYSERVHDIIDSFMKDDNISMDPEVVWRQFHQNNYKNPKFVDIIEPIKLKRSNEDMDFDDFGNPYVYHSSTDPSIEIFRNKKEFVTVKQQSSKVAGNEELREEYAKKKMWDKMYDYTLYQRVGQEDEYGYHQYVPIDKLGNGMYMIEVSPDEFAQSVLTNRNTSISTPSRELYNQINVEEGKSFADEMAEQGVSADPTKGTIKLNIIEDWVQKGTASSTVRNNRYHKSFYKGDGIYRTEKGNTVSIKHLGFVEMKGDKIVGDGFSYTKNEFANKEGYGTWENFKKGAKYAGKNLMNGEMVHMYEIKAVKLDVAPVQTVSGQLKVKKIISGGQTGVDRTGLEAGKEIGLQTGGTATPGFATETGKDLTLKDFGVEEISTELQAGKSGKEFYLPRTEQNVLNSDGTVYFATDEDSAGKIATERFAKKHNKPFLLNPTAEQLRNWLISNNIETLNVAGNRGSKLSKGKAEEIKNTIKQALSSQTDMGRQAQIEPGYGLTAANFQDETDAIIKQKEQESKNCNQ